MKLLLKNTIVEKAELKPRIKRVRRVQGHSIMVDNPFYQAGHKESKINPIKVKCTYNPKGNPVLWMYQHNYIGASQLRAAVKFQEIYDEARTSIKAINYSSVKVNSSIWGDYLQPRRMDAIKRLKEVHHRLGAEGYQIVSQICGECLWVKDIEASEYKAKKASKNLKQSLTALARFFGYGT